MSASIDTYIRLPEKLKAMFDPVRVKFLFHSWNNSYTTLYTYMNVGTNTSPIPAQFLSAFNPFTSFTAYEDKRKGMYSRVQ